MAISFLLWTCYSDQAWQTIRQSVRRNIILNRKTDTGEEIMENVFATA